MIYVGNAVARFNKTRRLRHAQQAAIEPLLTGKTDQEIAHTIEMNRQIVTTWRNKDELFQAALNAQRCGVWGSHVGRLRELVTRVLQTLEDNLGQDEDHRLRQSAASHILRCVGLRGAG